MEFGWISIFGASIVAMMMLPKVIYLIMHGSTEYKYKDNILAFLKHFGRISCIVLMWLPLFMEEFGFVSTAAFIAYMVINASLLTAYLISWKHYIKEESFVWKMAIAVLAMGIFLISGLLLQHKALIIAAIIYGIGMIKITYKNEKLVRAEDQAV